MGFLDADREYPYALASGLVELFAGQDTDESEAAAMYLSECLIGWRKGQEKK